MHTHTHTHTHIQSARLSALSPSLSLSLSLSPTKNQAVGGKQSAGARPWHEQLVCALSLRDNLLVLAVPIAWPWAVSEGE